MNKTTAQTTSRHGLASILFLVLAGLLAATTLRAQVTWNATVGTSTDTNWSTAGNWLGGIPGPTANILFTNYGGATAVSNINNVVDITTNVLSLLYAATNTTLINSGITLAVSNNAATQLMLVGTRTDNGVSQIEDATITGPNGTLTVVSTNVGSLMVIQQGSSTTGTHNALLDLSGLGTFNLTAGRLLLAANDLSAANPSNYTSGSLLLAATNMIHLNGASSSKPTLDMGDAVSNPNPTCTNILQLGQTNSLYVDALTVGAYKSSSPGSILKFNPSLAGNNPVLYLRGDTATRVGTLAIGDNLGGPGGGTGSASQGLVDLSLGTVDAQVNTCYVGRGQQTINTGAGLGTLLLGAGVFNVNSLNLAIVGTNNTQAGATGIVTITNSLTTLVINGNLVMGLNPNTNTAYSPVAKATLNITNGTVYANAITSTSTNGVIGIINVSTGALYITNSAGTPVQPLAALNLISATLHLNGSLTLTNIVATNVTGTASVIIDSAAYPGYGTVTNALISYTGTDPYNNLTFSIPAAYIGNATVVDNQAYDRIDLVVTGGPATPILGSVLWGGGVNNQWNFGASNLNWTNGVYTTVYGDSDFVTFNDLGETGNVNLTTSVSPGSVTVSNAALNYTISGTGGIAGSGGLTKSGSGTLTLSTVNTYSGTTVVNGSTITATVAGALSRNSILSFGAATNATLNLQGTAQTVAGMTFGNANSNNIIPITITGTTGSALTVTPGNVTVAPAWSSNYLTLNLSGLSSFTYSNASGTLAVNSGTGQQNPAGLTAINLAGGNNLIMAGTLGVGNSGTSAGIANSTLNLGTNNTLDVGTITMGSGRSDGTIQFASGITGGTLTIAGSAGGNSTAALNEGNHDSYQASDKPVELIDTTAGTLNAQFGAMTMGVLAATANSTNRGINMTESFKMGAGTLTAASLTMGVMNNVANVTNYTATITTLFSITNGGKASITNLTLLNNNLANVTGFSDNLTNNATVSLTNGATLLSTTVQIGAAASPAATSALLAWGDATVGNIPGGNLTVNGIAIALSGISNNHSINITSGQTGLINSWITGTGTLTDMGAGALTLGGNNSFAGSLIMSGTGTLTLTRTNTYNGSTLINSGSLILGAAASISNSPAINVASNAVFDVSAVTGGFVLGPSQSLAGGGTNNGSITAAPGAQILPGGAGAAGTLTFNNNLALNGQFITFDLGATPASSGDLLNVIGTVTLNANTEIAVNELAGPLAIGSYTLMNYASLAPNGFNFVLVGPRNWTLTAGPNALILTVGAGGSANLTWVGDGVSNNWDVQTTTNWFNPGTLTLDYFYALDNVTFGNTGSDSPAINLAATLYPGSVTVNASQNYTFSGAGQLAGSMALTNAGAGTLTLTTSNTYSGGTVINQGTVQLAFTNAVAGQAEAAAGTGPITILPAGALSITNDGFSTLHIIVTNVISGSGNINLPQNQEVSFNGPGSMAGFTGAINIPSGTGATAKGDILGSAVNLSSSATINVANGGTLWAGASGETVPATVNVSGLGNGEGWGALRVDTGAVYSGPVNMTGNASIGAENGASGTISGVISDGGHNYSLTKLGAATVVLTGANTYGGGTIVSNGTLQVGTGIINNGTLPGNVNIAGTNAILAFVVATNTTQVYNGIISGSGSLYEGYASGAGQGGTLVVNGNNTFTNGVNINGGAMWINNVAALGTGSKVINISAGTAGHPELHLNGTNGNILLPSTFTFLTSWAGTTGSLGAVINEAGNNEIDGNFNLTSGGGGTTFWVNGGALNLMGTLAPITTLRTLEFGGVGSGTVSGIIADGPNNTNLVGVTVAGPGTWTFAGNNTYVTNTTISGGRLLVNGSPTGSGTTIVQTNGILGGSGTIGSTVNVQAGGAIQGGDANYANELTVNILNLGQASTNISYSKFTVSAGGAVNTSTLNVNGTNFVQVLDSTLTVGTYPLFYYFNGPVGGTSGSAGIQIGTLPNGVVANLNDTGGEIDLVVTSVPSTLVPTIPPGITNFSVVGGNVVVRGTNGQAGYTYYLLTTTNLANPVSQWNTVATNVLGAGNYTFIGTNAAGNLGQQFYRLSSTNYNPVSPY